MERSDRLDRDCAQPSQRYRAVRAATERLAAPLSAEDQTIQSMPDASPTKWHRAHTTWFFETFVLIPHVKDYRPFDECFGFLFNSYYEAFGARHERGARGLISRPGIAEIEAYRAHVDAAMQSVLTDAPASMTDLIELGLHHEQQHQELLLTDIKHLLAANPLAPAYAPAAPQARNTLAPPTDWLAVEEGKHVVGHHGSGFAFDNEGPEHRVWLDSFRIASRPVSVGEYLEFVSDGGYRQASLWLADGWARATAEAWQAPAYWQLRDGEWHVFTLHGLRPLEPAESVCHISHYEAAAYAAWAGKRLPTEFEWEVAARRHPAAGDARIAPHPGPLAQGFVQDVWEWTASAYLPYPRFRPSPGAVGEYNGKFMSGQMVLRGRSCATPAGHARLTYRNFFNPAARWQFSGVRLAADE